MVCKCSATHAAGWRDLHDYCSMRGIRLGRRHVGNRCLFMNAKAPLFAQRFHERLVGSSGCGIMALVKAGRANMWCVGPTSDICSQYRGQTEQKNVTDTRGSYHRGKYCWRVALPLLSGRDKARPASRFSAPCRMARRLDQHVRVKAGRPRLAACFVCWRA